MPIDYIMERFMRPIPPDCCVVPDSLPVIANGDPGVARVATIGLNPGGAEQRGTRSIEEEWERQKGYFLETCYRYFGHFERILKTFEASYGGKYDPDGSYDIPACNLDLVCWATTPHWTKALSACPGADEKLIEADKEFLANLLMRNRNIELVLAAPIRVVNELKRSHGAHLQEESVGRDRLFYGELLVSGKKVIGWNRVTRFLSRDAKQRVGEIAREWEILPARVTPAQ